jgi:branched-chain amino acid transport system permease protein
LPGLGSLIQALIGGLAAGAAYGLIAIGISLIYRTTRVVNFAQGDIAAFGAYLGWAAFTRWHLPIGLVFVAVPVAVGLGMVVVERVALRPLYNRGFLPPIISTIGLSFAIESVITLIWGPLGKTFPSTLGENTFKVLGVTLVPQSLWILLIGIMLTLLIHWFLVNTKVGTAMRATAHSPALARLMGIPADRMFAGAFFLAGAFGALAGLLVAPTTYMTPTMGLPLGLAGFVAAAIGGFGSIHGAFIGGLIVAVASNVATLYVDPALHDVITYVVFALFLVFRPMGIFGEEGAGVRGV